MTLTHAFVTTLNQLTLTVVRDCVGARDLVLGPVVASLVAGAVLAPAPARAQTQEPPSDALRFESQVVVTPERGETPRLLLPASTVALEARSLPLLPAVRTSDLATNLPGFQFMQAEPHASGPPLASARGFFGGGEAEYMLLLVDGVPVADAESGLIDWSLVPTTSIQRVEAFRGPGASMYGDAAVGGVIQILTNRPEHGGQVSASGGSFATIVGDGTYGGRMGSVNFLVSGSTLHSASASDHGNRTELVANGAVDGKVHQMPWRVVVSGAGRNREDPGARTANEFETDPFGSNALFQFDRLDRHGVTTAFTLTRSGSWQQRMRVFGSTRQEDNIRTILLAPSVGDRRARDLSTAALGGSVETDRGGGLGRLATLRFGLDVSREHVDTTYHPVTDGRVEDATVGASVGRRLRGGAFVLANWDPASRVRISGSLRWDGIDDDFSDTQMSATHDAWSPRVGTSVVLDRRRSIALFAQVSHAFKAPTVNQLFDPRPYPDFRGGTFTISNPHLEPQRVTNAEVGVSGGGRLRWSALAYRMWARNEIDFDLRTFSYANIGESEHLGVELEGAGTFWTRVQPAVSYAMARVNETGSDTQLKNITRHIVSASVNVDLPWALSAFARYRRTTGAFLDDDNLFAIEGPSAVDLRIRRPFGRHTIFFDALNVGDDRYQEYGYTLPDFRGRPAAYSYPGAPRAIRAGATLSF